ncbi:helix-turn-helix domain-containing protein [Streptomyces colonosanans]|uniref:helix-turn-helix domain-containing protein n=1 Tax=Streptomyces colonosanans TaxID=1428652 RepID=UPI003CCBC7E1
MRENYHEPLVLDDLARSAMMSKFYFIRVFQRTTGVTPGRFLSAVRLHEAKSHLVHSSLNVAEISARVGYSSASTFSRRFTASVGLSPTQFRRSGRGLREGRSACLVRSIARDLTRTSRVSAGSITSSTKPRSAA